MALNPMSMIMNTTPLGKLAKSLQDGGNPIQVLQQMAPNNPQMQMGLKIAQQQGPKGIEQYARNMCKERGINPDDMLRQMGLK